MRTGAEILCLFLIIGTTSMRCLEQDVYKPEAHSIMKRMAAVGRGFEEHDVARVHLVESRGRAAKRLFKRDLTAIGSELNNPSAPHLLQLQLASGSNVNLSLTPVGIVDHDTVVSFRTAGGVSEENLTALDCYSHGHVEDSNGTGWATVSLCDGVFGFANSGGFEYFLHPVESKRSRRDTAEENDYDVHVMWRRSVSEDTYNHTDEALTVEGVEMYGAKVDRGNLTSFVVEMSLTSDAEYCATIRYLYPGRENDYLLTKLAGVQALFSNREKMGYDVELRVKLLEYWDTDPEEYTFTQDLGKNLRSFCRYTTKQYFYDVHALNTGVENWNDGQMGLAYASGACTGSRCFTVRAHDLDSFQGFAHELGHTLGLSHHTSCHDDEKSEGGFMGGNSHFNFSPCMKRQMHKFIHSSKANCLFKTAEKNITSAPAEFSDFGSLYPGQMKSPDDLCHLLAGPEFKYMPNHRDPGANVCKLFMCRNEQEDSLEYHRVRHFTAPAGFPCKEEGYCDGDKCKFWNQTKITLETETLRSLTTTPEWSEWSTDYSKCSRSCGGGVRTRRRVCQYPGYNLAPYCPGMHLKPELCNTHPCPGDPEKRSDIRKAMGHEVCSKFLDRHVRLKLKKANAYLPDSGTVTTNDVGQSLNVFKSNSCLLKCIREPKDVKGDLDAIMPDGAPCLEETRSDYNQRRLNISMQCLGGYCVEFSDCPDILEVKDECGVCGGDAGRCVKVGFNSTYNVPRKERAFLMDIPASATHIDVHADPDKNEGIVVELWSQDGRNIIGDGGLYERDVNHPAVEFAGATWTYDPKDTFYRAAGPLNESIHVKFLRLGPPLHSIIVRYVEGV